MTVESCHLRSEQLAEMRRTQRSFVRFLIQDTSAGRCDSSFSAQLLKKEVVG